MTPFAFVGLALFMSVAVAAFALRRRVELEQQGADLAPGFNLFNLAEETAGAFGIGAGVDQLTADRNLQAFLHAIRWAEGTDDDNGWRALFGHLKRRPRLFSSFDDHPRERTYEAYDGQFIANGRIDYTTAAGAFQITETTYNRMSKRLGLAGFSPAVQQAIAVALIDEKGALRDVQAGRLAEAAHKVRQVWASLPAAGYGQPERDLAGLQAAYTAAGGGLA
jgi:lysozyme